MRNHILSWLKKLYFKDTRHALLNFQLIVSFDASRSSVGELGTWVFNQDSIGRTLVEMIIIDELLFRGLGCLFQWLILGLMSHQDELLAWTFM